MIDLDSLSKLGDAVRNSIDAEHRSLEEMRMEVRSFKSKTLRIHPRKATAISLVGTDGGDNLVRFDPFMVQVIRVVDSSHNQYCLEVVTPKTKLKELDARHLNADGTGRTVLGNMMEYLGIKSLSQLSPVFKKYPEERKPSWVKVYREMTEWAVLFALVRQKDFANDTVIVTDGFLRSKMFSGILFKRYREGLEDGIRQHFENNKRRIYVVGIAKHSKVLQTYRLAMAIEGVMRNAYPCYVLIDPDFEKKVYKWSEYARGDESEMEGGEANKFVAGKMFFVKFGSRPRDPIWAIDLLSSQASESSTVFGYLLEDAMSSFPVPYYPQCLQRAHENAALVDLDMDILQDEICKALRQELGEKKWMIDEFVLQENDPSARRYW